jgi:hypothetical protein
MKIPKKIKKAQEIVNATTWEGDIRININRIISAGRTLSKYIDELATKNAKNQENAQKCSLAKMPHAYKYGNNACSSGASYHCDYCGLQLYDEEVGYIAAGRMCANGEHSCCPQCGEENPVFR